MMMPTDHIRSFCLNIGKRINLWKFFFLDLLLEERKRLHTFAILHNQNPQNISSTPHSTDMSSLHQFEHLRIPLAVIKSTTNNFDRKYLIGGGGFGRVYRGELLHCGELINIAIRRLDLRYGQGDKEFWTEISMLASLKHSNLVSIVGYCDEAGEKVIINKHAVNGSLDVHLSNPTLTWMQRLQICVGAARALRYIHYETGHDYDVIHRNIKSSKVLLDENWEAKVGGFGLSIKNFVTRRHRIILDAPCGTIGYIDPAYVTSGSLTHKSDVYSFGVVLLEVLTGMRAILYGNNNKDHQALVPIARQAYEAQNLEEIVDSDIREQSQPQSLSIFSETAYYCLKEERTQRPDMRKVVIRLEKAMELQRKHENPVHLGTPVEVTSPNHFKGKDLELLKIGFDTIKFSTENFDEKYFIGKGGFGTVYKAELDHFDSSAVKGEMESENRKKRSTVAIKHIREHTLGEQGFITEIEALTTCKHPNIVSLLGFCYEHPQMFLVYEYVCNGSLEDYLGSEAKMTNLTWVQRIQICIDIACGLDYLHTASENKKKIIHRDIKSANILLGTNWEAKIADFGLSKFHQASHKASTLITRNIAGTQYYTDPEYAKTGKLKKATDIYSFGVVLFEILVGRLAYDPRFTRENEKGLAPIARRHFDEGKIKELLDPKLMEETGIFAHRRLNQNSWQTFSKIAYQCLEETQAQRPKMKDVISELRKALEIQISSKDNLQISLADIKLATQDFDDSRVIGKGGFGKVYKGEVTHANGREVIAAKRLDTKYGQGEPEFLKVLEILLEYKHKNVIGLIGYCDEAGEKIILYEYVSRGSLDRLLNNHDLTWPKRLRVCIDVASGLEFLHGGEEVVIHRDMKSANVLLNDDWEAKISDFGLSSVSTINEDVDYVIDNAVGTAGYCDPLYMETGFLTKESDIYSFGAVLCEILSGKLIVENSNGRLQIYIRMYKRQYEEGKLDEIVFEGIKEQILPHSLAIFAEIAYQCLQRDRRQRPTATEVVIRLKKALEFQEDYDVWEPKLPKDYLKIIQMSKSPEMYSTFKKEDLYNVFSRGMLVQDDKVLLSFDGNGERNEMISATEFSYIYSCPHKWKSLSDQSRFHKVAEMFDISDLMIKIDARPRFLSPNVVYGVYLIFKFCDSRNFTSNPMYVNLKYKRGSETLKSYFGIWRDDEWMMIEMYRFLNEKEDVVLEFLLESISTHYFVDNAIYVEGVEFRSINHGGHEETKESKEVQKDLSVNAKVDQVHQLPTKSEVIFERSQNFDDSEKLYSLSEVNNKKQLMLSAKAAFCNFSDLKKFSSRQSIESRFEEVIELLPQQAFYINCRIKSQMLSRDTTYACYLVFRLSEKSQGFDCPVEVRDLLHRENKETNIIYFVSPSPWNIHDMTRVPEQREDGWREVNVWKFNSSDELENDCISLNLKLVSYEGTMSGLIVCGLEFRPA